ncbi:hypothetical protein C2G38_2161560 [Gigaspora rosea]|uniref:Uncharacterized protein n=1 Tax=Gigaspora rosea TaxID=44941 RepID=A0A397W189_9GLOM|nr:hypothetical protein C2G38_2161560 [Gigaspora rosea]
MPQLFFVMKKNLPSNSVILQTLFFLITNTPLQSWRTCFPVAAVERDKQVVISKNSTFTVGDHDYTKAGIVPSVTMICDIPDLLMNTSTAFLEESRRMHNVNFEFGLQYVGLMRRKMEDNLEKLMNKANAILVRDIFEHQSLKEVPFKTYDAPQLKEFMDHCCFARHYFFSIKKCGKIGCLICRPYRCTPEEFELLGQLPDPVPGDDLYYKSFKELYGTSTTEQYRPSLKDFKPRMTKTGKTKNAVIKIKYTMPFSPSAARAKNVGITVTCVECEKPRLLFSMKKLASKDWERLQRFLDTILYTCGTSFCNTCDLTKASNTLQQVSNLDVDSSSEISSSNNVKENEFNEINDIEGSDKDDEFGKNGEKLNETDEENSEQESYKSDEPEESDENEE